MRYVENRGAVIPQIGFGAWTFGDNPSNKENEINTVLYGINNFSMTLIDTAEMYGSGKSESVVKEIIKKADRNKLFIVDKILPNNATKGNFLNRCKKSLETLDIDYIDLYLLHWRANVDLQTVVDEMEDLVSRGLIKRWGVSNFDVKDMEELFKCKNGKNCFCNQVLYNVGVRGPEFDLIPWCEKNEVLFMAYSPLYGGKEEREKITKLDRFANIAKKENMTPEALMLNFVVSNKNIVTIFKTSSIDHLKGNMENVFKEIDIASKKEIDALFNPPVKKHRLKAI